MSDLRSLYVVDYLIETFDSIYGVDFGSIICLREKDALAEIATLVYQYGITESELEENDCTPRYINVVRCGTFFIEACVKEVMVDVDNLERIR